MRCYGADKVVALQIKFEDSKDASLHPTETECVKSILIQERVEDENRLCWYECRPYPPGTS